MKNCIKKAITTVWAFMLILSVLPRSSVYGAEAFSLDKYNSEATSRDIMNFIIQKTESRDIADFISKSPVSDSPAMYNWYIMGLLQSGEKYDFSKYANSLKSNEATGNENPVEQLRRALTLCAFNPNDDFVSNALDTNTGKMGIMSYIFALHVLNNGGISSIHSIDEVIDSILNLCCDEGGWALNGSTPDVDTTAMALQCLAPYYGKNVGATKATDKALDVLSHMQNDNGGFSSFGNENSESTAQVVIALCSLGISPASDSKFIKNSLNPLDALLSYRLADGSFEHIKNKGYNFKATEQAFLTFTALNRFSRDNSPLFILDRHDVTPVTTEDSPGEPTSPTESGKSIFSFLAKKPLANCAAAFGVISGIFILVFRKKNKKLSNVFTVLLVLSAVGTLLLNTNFSSPEEYYTVTSPTGTETVTVSMEIRCDTVKQFSEEKDYIPKDGTVLPLTEITLPKNSTVYDCLIFAAKKYNIQIENSSYTGANSAYISSIGYIKEFDFGNLSGWMYTVNGNSAQVGCGECAVNDGDKIQWLYTCSLGDDIK